MPTSNHLSSCILDAERAIGVVVVVGAQLPLLLFMVLLLLPPPPPPVLLLQPFASALFVWALHECSAVHELLQHEFAPDANMGAD